MSPKFGHRKVRNTSFAFRFFAIVPLSLMACATTEAQVHVPEPASRKPPTSRNEGKRKSLTEVFGWMWLLPRILLSFSLDAITYVLIVPHFRHSPPNWTFFSDQSPWIWMSYLVLLLSALAAQQTYARRINA
jgi:hypothetical protein